MIMDTYDVFICYQHKAKKVVDFVVEALKQAGISCWYAPRNSEDEIVGKSSNDVGDTIINARCLIAVVSDEALESQMIKHEIVLAIEKHVPMLFFEIAPTNSQDGMYLRSHIKERIVAYENPSTSIEALIRAIKGILSNKNSEPVDSNKALSNEIGTRGQYSIMQNEQGEIMLMMNAREGEPENPRFIYDGSGTALLYRNQDSSVAFRNISEEAREPLKNVDVVLVVEVLNDDVEREYMAPVRIVKNVENLML